MRDSRSQLRADEKIQLRGGGSKYRRGRFMMQRVSSQGSHRGCAQGSGRGTGLRRRSPASLADGKMEQMPVGSTFGVGKMRDSNLMVSVFSEK